MEPSYSYVWPQHNTEDGRRKLICKHVLASIVAVLSDVMSFGPQTVVGAEHGALIAVCLSRPLVIEATCRARIITAPDMYRLRYS